MKFLLDDKLNTIYIHIPKDLFHTFSVLADNYLQNKCAQNAILAKTRQQNR